MATTRAYDAEGRTIATWGATYPVAYEYDASGRMTAMHTTRSPAEITSAADIFTLSDRTTWSYDQPTGLLTNKLYADGKGTAYTYTPEGKLASRIWARGVTTTYAYTNGSSLAAIDYSDSTPGVTFTYDRLGHMASAIVAGVSTNLFTYDALDLVAETQNGVVITRTTDALGRPSGFTLDDDYAVSYAYDMFGRFHSLASASSATSAVTFTYSYLPDSDLISGMTASSGFLWARAYESARSLIASVENRFGETVISRYDYTNDALGRRTAISRSGLAFGEMPVRDTYGYNLRSEVTSARRTPVGSQTEVRGFSYDYGYDPIGNRVTSTEYDHEDNALVSAYTANALNQYERRTVPGYAGVRGTATNTATVTVNGNPAWRLDEYFYGGDEADNSLAAVMKQLAITAVYNSPGTNDPDVVTSTTGRVFVAQTPEAFTYYDDGNLTRDGRFTYTWDAENRLIGVTTRADLPASVPRIRVEYTYDHQSRRIASVTAVRTNGTWQAAESRAFLYDGWNVIRETVAVGSGSPQSVGTNLYTWGLDLSGTLQGAGGIGGLLAASLDGTSVLYGYDANGNVCQLVGTDGELLAHYEYSPFGETIVSAGPLAKANPFRFSTKHWDNLTGLGYWGYRWYSPGLGRWMSRDPIGERGGLNLHVFLLNKVVNHIDALGQLSSTLPGYSKKDFSMKASGSKGLGGHISILIVRESAKHCCTSGQFYGQMKDIVEWTFGPEIGAHVGVNLTVQFAGVGVDVGFTGPGISLRLGNVTKTFDRCFPDDAFAHLELINLEIAPGIQNVAIGLGYLAKVEGRMKAWFDFQANVDVTPDGFDLNGGIFVDYDVSIKGYLGFEEFILLNIDTLAPDGKHQRIPLVEF